jgi:ABC-2 type transport system permease protein
VHQGVRSGRLHFTRRSAHLDAFTTESAILLIVYFILGYALYAVMNSVCGASVSKIEDLNSALMPVMFISLISFYLGYISAAYGSEGTISKIATYLPFSSPFILPFKLINGNYTATEVGISTALLVVSIVIVAYISTRIYSASVLHYGKRQKLVDLYKTKL